MTWAFTMFSLGDTQLNGGGKMFSKNWLFATLLLALGSEGLTQEAMPQEGRTSGTGSRLRRMEKPHELAFALNKPAPALLGVVYSYSISPLLKGEVGYGELGIIGAKASALGSGVTLTFPDWDFTPSIGVHLSYASVEGDSWISLSSVKNPGLFCIRLWG